MLLKKSESGRSIVEMLGVLAIMGVITVMGISGYSQAISRINRNKVFEEVTRISQEVRTMYAGSNTYGTLTTENIYLLMGYSDTFVNPFNGDYVVGPINSNNNFCVGVTKIPQVDCVFFQNMAFPQAVDENGVVIDKSFVHNTSIAKDAEIADSNVTGANDTCSEGAVNMVIVCYK